MGKKRIVVGLWDCSYCGTKGISGLEKQCPHCSNPQAKGTKFYVNKNNITALEPEKAKNYGKGADWICSYCNSYNRVNQTTCRNCGASKQDSETNYFNQNHKNSSSHYEEKNYNDDTSSPYDEDNFGDDDSFSKDNLDFFDSPIETQQENNHSNTENSNFFNNLNFKAIFSILGGTAILFGIIFLLVQIFTPRTYSAILEEKTWERNVAIQELKTLEENDWSVPAGGRVYDTRREIRTYESVIDHYTDEPYEVSYEVFDHYEYSYTDNGDGTFTEEEIPVYRTETETHYRQVPVYVQVPVYDTKYYYEIDRWCYDRTEKASGTTNPPYWPEFTLGELEKEQNRSETYTFKFKTEDKSYNTNVSFIEWQKRNIGDEVSLTVTAGFVTKIEPELSY